MPPDRDLAVQNEPSEKRLAELEEELRKVKRHLDGLFRHPYGLFALLLPNGVLTRANPNPLQAVGFCREAVESAVGHPIWDAPWWNRSPQVQEALKANVAAAREGSIARRDAIYFAADGSERFASVTLYPLWDEDGRIRVICLTGIDITERKRAELDRERLLELEQKLHQETLHERDRMNIEVAERRRVKEALQEAEERLRLATEAADIATWDYDLTTGEARWSKRCREMLGVPPDAEVSLPLFLTWLHPDDSERIKAAAQRALDPAGNGEFDEEFRVVKPDKTVIWLMDKGKAFFEGEGQDRHPVRFMGAMVDSTARRMAEEQIRRDQKLEGIGILAGGIAHDFNNLLTAILGNASLAMEEIPPGSPAVSMLRTVVETSQHAASLTRQLLAYAGKSRFLIQSLNVSDLVRGIADLIRTLIPKLVELHLELNDDVPCIEADASQIQQIIMNLVINGAEAIGEEHPGTVWIRTSSQNVDEAYLRQAFSSSEIGPGKYVTIEVQDTGCGMDPETMARIFDPFFTTKFTGRGLGLSAVLGIVRSHKGTLNVYSTPGKGSIFKLLFPSAGQAVRRRDREEEKSVRDLTGRGTVLVVDDEEVVRRTVRGSLERYGYTVLEATNGREGVERFREMGGRIDLVILDLTMPVMGGEEALQHLKAIRPDVRVVLSSGYSEMEAVRRFEGASIASFVQKPYTAAELITKVHDAMASGRSVQS